MTPGGQARDWRHADDLGSRSDLRCVAVRALADGGVDRHAGFIGVVELSDGRWVATDDTWRAWRGDGEPPVDGAGRRWQEVEYDDSRWPRATELGPYGSGPWGTDKDGPKKDPPQSRLDAAMRRVETTGTPIPFMEQISRNLPKGTMLPVGTSIDTLASAPQFSRIVLNASWIWAGPGLHPAPVAYFRKRFDAAAAAPPTRPSDVRVTAVTPTSFTLAWRPSFAPQGGLVYHVVWNGQRELVTPGTTCTIAGISVNPEPQNYAYVIAAAGDGVESQPSPYVLVATTDTQPPGPVANLRVLERRRDGFRLAWDAATDDVRIGSYAVFVGSYVYLIPGSVTTCDIAQAKACPPGTSVAISVEARDTARNRGPAIEIAEWTLPAEPRGILPPTDVRVAAPGRTSRITWNPPTSGTPTGYRLWCDGAPVGGTIAVTTADVPPAGQPTVVQVSSIDGAGNESARSEPLLLRAARRPAGPVAVDAGRHGHGVSIRWRRAEPGTAVGYRVERHEAGAWRTAAVINDPRHDRADISGLAPGSPVRVRVSAISAAGDEVAGPPLDLTTVAPPAADASVRFAVIIATDGKNAHLDAALADAVAEGCAFALVKGQLVPQLSEDERDWQALKAVVDRYSQRLPIVLSPLSIKDTYSSIIDPSDTWALRDWGWMANVSRYDFFTHHTGQPLDQLHRAAGGSLLVAALTENPRSNPGFPSNLERWLQEAEADASCRWFFTSGLVPEAADPDGIPGAMVNLYRPSVEFMRTINGDRGHELCWLPGRAVATACPQRNRSNGHYIVSVEDRRLVLISRRCAADGRATTDGLQEIVYDRAANRLAPADLRVPHPAGVATGLPAGATDGPPWTQNRILTCPAGGDVQVRLLGRSPRGAPLRFTIVRPPRSGTLQGVGGERVYRPEAGFVGEDGFLYRADDGGRWPGNTAWVRIAVRPPASR